MKIKIEDLENDLEMVINKYNELIAKYNALINKKNIDDNKTLINRLTNRNNNILLNSIKKRLNNKIANAIINHSHEKNFNKITYNNNYIKQKKLKNKQIKNISLIGNNKNINSFDNDYIINLRKENDILKKLLITYKETINLSKGKNHFNNNNRSQRFTNQLTNSINKNNSRDHQKTGSKNKISGKSPTLFIIDKINNSLVPIKSLAGNSITHVSKNKLKSDIPKNNKAFNTINANIIHQNIIKKHNTYVSSILDRDPRINMNKKIMTNKLSKNKDFLIKEKINSNINYSYNLSKEKSLIKYTPKNITGPKSNESFFAHTNYNIKNETKNHNKLNSFKKLELDNENNYINLNINDSKNNTISHYFYNDNCNNNENNINLINRINTETNNTFNSTINNIFNNNLIINRNTEHKLGNKFRLMKEFKTEEENINLNGNNENYYSNNINKIKINRKNIFYKKSQNSLRDAIIINQTLNQTNDKENIFKTKINNQIMNAKAFNNNIKNSLILDNKNINNKNSMILNSNSKKLSNKLPLNKNNKILEKTSRITNLRNDKLKMQSKTINNISNFNNCNYIYLLNNGEKYVKINKQYI